MRDFYRNVHQHKKKEKKRELNRHFHSLIFHFPFPSLCSSSTSDIFHDRISIDTSFSHFGVDAEACILLDECRYMCACTRICFAFQLSFPLFLSLPLRHSLAILFSYFHFHFLSPAFSALCPSWHPRANCWYPTKNWSADQYEAVLDLMIIATDPK